MLTLPGGAAAREPGVAQSQPLTLRVWSCDGVGYASQAVENGGRRGVDLRDLPGAGAVGPRAAIVCAAFGDLVCEWRENPAVEARLAALYAQ